MNDTGKDMIYLYQGTEVNFNVKEAKALLNQLEVAELVILSF